MSSLLEFAPGVAAHASGALWLSVARTVIIADAHLGYGWALRRRGALGPVIDNKSEPKLKALVEELRPTRIVFLGDLVHAPRPSQQERAAIEGILQFLGGGAELILVRGNHDRSFASDFGHVGVEMVESWRHENLTALHGDRLNTATAGREVLVLGHLHPSLRMRDAAGAVQRIPLFVFDRNVIVLPAFSPFAAGFDIARGLPPGLATLLDPSAIEGIAATGIRAVRLGYLDRLRKNVAWDLAPRRHFR